MKRILLMCVVFTLVACEYKTRLVTDPTLTVDASFLGTWQREGRREKLQIIKINDHRYFATVGTVSGVATPCPVDDIPVFQTEFLAPLTDGTKNVKYELMYWRAQRNGDTLKVAYLNSQLVPYDTATREELLALIRKHKRNPQLFEEEATFVKTDEQPSDALQRSVDMVLPFLERKWKGEDPVWEELMQAYSR